MDSRNDELKLICIIVNYFECMKKFLLIGFIVSNLICTSAQSRAVIQVEYETKIITDSLNRDKISYMPYTLLSNNEESFYYNKDAEKFFNGLFGNKKEKNNDLVQTSLGAIPKYPKYKGSVHKLKDKLSVSLPIGKYIFNFEEPALQWEILKDTKEIKGYKCQLARTTTDTKDVFFAWFTKDIPIQEGPFRFKGLSGMILEVYNKNKTIEIYATEIRKSDQLIETINYGNDFLVLKSKDEYLKARKNYIENPSAYNGNNIKIYDAGGNNITRKINEVLSKNNVFLD